MAINLNPTLEEEIRQNIETILTTSLGSVPLDRGFGIPMTSVDEQTVIAQARLSGQVMTAIAKYETRVTVNQVTFEQDQATGTLKPVVNYTIKGGIT